MLTICIATCNRNSMLDRCLQSIADAFKPKSCDFNIVVVDNNDVSSSKSLVESFKDKLDIHYEWEKKIGIPFARNRCLEKTLSLKSDYIVFIDDDEWVEKDWLVNLVACIEKEKVDVVSGDVNQLAGEMLKPKKKIPDGLIRDRAETDNVIFKTWIAEKVRFDEDFAMTGGSDTLFFRRACELGAVIKHCSCAVVNEELPTVRQKITWRLQRQFRYGLTHGMIEKKLVHGKSFGFLLLRAIALVLLGLMEMVTKLLYRGLEGSFEGLDRMVRGVGSLAHILGFDYNEYKR